MGAEDNKEYQEPSLRELIWKIQKFWRYLCSKWLTILIAGFLGGILGGVYAYFKRPIFSAETTFVLQEDKPGGGMLGQLGGLAGLAGIDLGGGGGIFEGDNILELYKSSTMIEKTLLSEITISKKKQLLIDHYISFNHLREKWLKQPELKNINFIPDENQPFNRVQDSILAEVIDDIKKQYLTVTKPDKKLSIVKVAVKAKDENFAKAFNDQIVRNVNDFYVQTKTKKSQDNVAVLQRKTDSVRAVMNGAIYQAVAVSDATPNVNPTRQIQRVAPMQRAQFSAESNKLILGELVKNLELSKISLHKETPLLQLVDYPKFPLKVEKMGKIKGAVLGAIFSIFIMVGYLFLNVMFKKIMKSE